MVCAAALSLGAARTARAQSAAGGSAYDAQYTALRDAVADRPHDAATPGRALGTWRASSELRFLCLAAIASEQLPDFPAAERHAVECLSHAGDGWLATGRNRTQIEGLLSRVRPVLGTLVVRGAAVTATVRVERVSTALCGGLRTPESSTAPMVLTADPSGVTTVRLPTGVVRVAVRSSAGAALERDVVVCSGAPVELDASAVGRPVVEAVVPLRESASGSVLRPTGWALLGVGAAGLVAGGVALGLWRASEGRFVAGGCSREGAVVSGGDACVNEARASQGLRNAAIVGLAAGGVLAATGAVLVAIAPRGSGSARVSASGCTPSAAPLGLSCGVEF